MSVRTLGTLLKNNFFCLDSVFFMDFSPQFVILYIIWLFIALSGHFLKNPKVTFFLFYHAASTGVY